jgi:YidC/Oxa1 family membrane protein insertase
MNQEVMKLYKDNKVNPMGGCLPMALQMPVLFALFRLFRSTIMFRQAPFLWIKDLAGPDALMQVSGFTLNILPVLMCVSTIVQQKLSTQDPRQKMMAYMMPVFLLFVFYKFSSGLNLYYFMFNVLTIAQELLAKRSRAAEE